MEELFGDLQLVTAGLEPETCEKIEALYAFHNDMEATNIQAMTVLMSIDSGDETERLAHLSGLYEVMDKDLQALRSKIFGKKEDNQVQ